MVKKEIIYLFENTYSKPQAKIDEVEKLSIEIFRLRQKHLMCKSSFNFTPFDYNNLITDQHFISLLTTIKNTREWVANANKRVGMKRRVFSNWLKMN